MLMKLHENITNKQVKDTFSTLEDRCKTKHNNRYTYENATYEGAYIPFTVTCPIHGDFKQAPNNHVNKGYGCPECGITTASKKQTKPTQKFILQAGIKHKEKYQYSKTNYIKDSEKVIITCCIHGDFEQTPNDHLSGRGCRECSILSRADKNRLGLSEFIRKSNIVHNNIYSYTNIDYTTTKVKVPIICKEHGIFEQTPSSHLQGNGCPKCAGRNKTTELFIKQSNTVHKHKYKYTNTVYIRAVDKVVITCPEHGDFKQRPCKHLQGKGCPECSTSGFNYKSKGILYYLSINDGEAYKIGITNHSVKERYSNTDFDKIRILHQIHYPIGQMAYDEEQRILKEFSNYRYIGKNLLKSGNTELFSIDILNLKDKIK